MIRWNGKHIFNPTNGAIAAMLLGFLLLCADGAVVHRALRSDVTYAFLIFYSARIRAIAGMKCKSVRVEGP